MMTKLVVATVQMQVVERRDLEGRAMVRLRHDGPVVGARFISEGTRSMAPDRVDLWLFEDNGKAPPPRQLLEHFSVGKWIEVEVRLDVGTEDQ